MKNSKYALFTNVLFLVASVVAPVSLFGQAKYDKAVAKVHLPYDNGDYAKAIKMNEKLKKKVTKKLGNENPYVVPVSSVVVSASVSFNTS